MKALPLVVFLLAAPALAAADDGVVSTLSAGSRVRAREFGGKRVTAEVIDVLPDALLVRSSPQAPVRRLDLSRLERLELSRGRHGHPGTGFVVAFVPGAALGFLAGGLACIDAEGPCGGEAPIIGVALGTVTGLIGALIGWAVQTERWEPIHLPGGSTLRLEPAMIPVRGGAAAGLTLRF